MTLDFAISNNDPCYLNFLMYWLLEYWVRPFSRRASEGDGEKVSPLSSKSPSMICTPRPALIFYRMLNYESSCMKFF